MALSYLLTCDRCAATSTTGAGWHRLSDVLIRIDAQVTVDSVAHHDLCPGCVEVVTLALSPDPLAGLSITDEAS